MIVFMLILLCYIVIPWRNKKAFSRCLICSEIIGESQTMELSVVEILIAMSVVSLGAFVQGAVGFGMAIVAAPMLYVIEPMLVPGPLITAALMQGVLSTRKYFDHIDFSALRFAILGRVPGSIIGAGLLTQVSSSAMSLVLGGTVLLAVLASLSSYKIATNSRTLFTAGMLSGIMGTAVSIGGPPMALLLQNESGDRIRANLAAFFVVGCLLSLGALAMGGLFDAEKLSYGLLLMPPVLIGSWLAGKVAHKIDKEMIRRALLFLCSISGLVAILTSIKS